MIPSPLSNQLAKNNLGPSTGSLLAGPLRQPAPPSVFQGTASVDGSLVPEGTTVSAWVEGIEVGTASVGPRPAVPASLSMAGEYFSPLGDTLKRVWSYDTPIQFWYFYDPSTAFAATSTLSEVLSGGIVWIEVSENVDLRGLSLYQGWNLVPLP